MNKTAIKNFSIWARNKLIKDIGYRAGLLGITENGIQSALPQSTRDTEFYDIGTVEPYLISGAAVEQRRNLVKAIRQKERDSGYSTAYQYIIEEVAYTWFNRLIAIRFMEVNDYLPSHIRVLSSDSGKLEPDLVTTPFDAELSFSPDEEQTIMQFKRNNEIDELFRLLFIKQCNALHALLPGLFEKTNDYTELLLRVSVVDQDGVVYHLIHDIDEKDFDVSTLDENGVPTGQVEIIGWLYQYYNTEPKNAVFGRPSGTKIKKEEIPAATQLFTPHWIVRYMVENSLGRLWVEGHPDETLKAGWKYYLEEAEQEPAVQAQLAEIRKEYASLNPEDIKCIDPCMGSGHILCYLFDVLMQIYESCGYAQRDAAQSIVRHNLYGLDIDGRAYQLAYFSVMMKARQYDRRFLTRDIEPHVYAVCESNGYNVHTVDYFANGNPARKAAMDSILAEMRDAKEYGSLLRITPVDFEALYRRFDEVFDDISIHREAVLTELLPLVRVAEALAQKYHVMCTNPPYMGGSGMNGKLSEFVKEYYPDSKTDLFAVFIERCEQMTAQKGYQAMITQHSWMFLSSFEKLRAKLQTVDTVNMAHLGARAFEEIGGEVVQTTSFIMQESHIQGYKGTYCRLIEPTTQQGKEEMFLSGANRYTTQQDNFSKIPGSPVAYWVSEQVLSCFQAMPSLGDKYTLLAGTSTGDNNRYQRNWFEVSSDSISRNHEARRWFPCNTGGEFHKYSLNCVCVIDWENDGFRIKNHINSRGKIGSAVRNRSFFFKEGITWNKLSSANFGVRYVPPGYISDDTARMIVAKPGEALFCLLGFLSSNVCKYFLTVLSPTMSFTNSELQRIPLSSEVGDSLTESLTECNYQLSVLDRDSFETSWDFKKHPLVQGASTVAEAYAAWEAECADRFNQLKANEEELNRIFIDIYDLQDELTPEVDDKDVTVRRADLGRDIRSLLSYAVGCMFGRYSLDTDGLAYAGGEWDTSRYVTFQPVQDGILPITDEDYLDNDIVRLLCQWLKPVYGADTLEQNLDFIAQALGGRGNTSRAIIRNYFLKGFFADHCKIYQKRPIYWLFDSGKQNGFQALIYLHRYTLDTIGNVRIDYLHQMQRVYENEIDRMQDMIDQSKNPREVAASAKRKEKLQKQLKECREYDERISHLA